MVIFWEIMPFSGRKIQVNVKYDNLPSSVDSLLGWGYTNWFIGYHELTRNRNIY